MLTDVEVEYENKYRFEFYDWAEKNAAPMGLSRPANIFKLLPKFQPYGLLRVIKSLLLTTWQNNS